MKAPPLPEDEDERLRSLASFCVLDTEFEQSFDDLTRLAAAICAAPMAAMTLIDRDRQWLKAMVGLEGRETGRDVSFCGHTILQPDILEIPDAQADERFHDNPAVTGAPNIRFYAGAPLTAREGTRLGALCVVDVVPRRLTAEQREALGVLRQQVEAQLELRRLSRALGEQAVALREQAEALAQLQREKDELMYFIVHDLRSPLASILPHAEMLREDSLDPAVQEGAGAILDAGRLLSRRVAEVLDLRRADRGTLTRRERAFDPGELLAEVAREIAGQARAHRQTIAVSSAAGEARSDPDLIRRILENLAANAMKYSPEGGTIRLSAEPEPGGGLRFAVTDQGAGVPAELREAIFAPDYRLPGDAARHAASSWGLGLAFCRKAADALGGRIGVEPAPEGGCRFWLTVPG